MAETASHLTDKVFPRKPMRQWVLTFPFQLRFLFARDPKVMGEVLGLVNTTLCSFLIKKAGLTKKSGARTGSLTFIQRFGGSLNLNIHFHTLFLDGVYIRVHTEMHKLFADTQYWIKNQSYKNWSELLTHFHHRLVSIHPFPNGNGRFSRIYTNHLCFKNQKPPPTWLYWLPPEKRRSLYINALRQADEKKFDSLIEFFSNQNGIS